MNKQEIQELAENALHEACRHIQDALGVTTGDTAGCFSAVSKRMKSTQFSVVI